MPGWKLGCLPKIGAELVSRWQLEMLIQRKFEDAFPIRKQITPQTSTAEHLHHIQATLTLQRAIRRVRLHACGPEAPSWSPPHALSNGRGMQWLDRRRRLKSSSPRLQGRLPPLSLPSSAC